jgi:hypothetical protein
MLHFGLGGISQHDFIQQDQLRQLFAPRFQPLVRPN